MVRVRRMLLAVVCAVVVALAVAMPVCAATTTLESGPLQPHVAQTYVFDCATKQLTNKSTGALIANGFDDGKCPVLQEGDAVEVIPEPSKLNASVMKGFIIADNPARDSLYPLEVTDTQVWGGSTYITGFKNAGETPLLVWSNGGGDYSGDKLASGDYYGYSCGWVDYRYYPNRVNVTYEYLDEGDWHYMG